MNRLKKIALGASAVGLAIGAWIGSGPAARADTITLRIASGHPPAVVYAGLMKNYFETEFKKRVESRTKHKINFVEGYSGSIVKVYEVFEGVRDGIVDIGGFCFCFEPSNLPLHAFETMLPFGTMDPTLSLKIAEDVYKEVPYLTTVFDEKFNQKLLAIIADAGYNLGTTNPWKRVSDLKGVKIGGAGLNLNWLKYAGVTPVQESLPEAYTGLKTHVYDGIIMFPSAYVTLKLYEPSPYYTLIGFGAITWHGMTINANTWKKLPKDVQDILVETAADYQQLTGTNNKTRYAQDLDTLRKHITVSKVSDDVRKEWAESLKDWPQAMATELEAKGLPAVRTLNLALDAAEKRGYDWPVRYVVK